MKRRLVTCGLIPLAVATATAVKTVRAQDATTEWKAPESAKTKANPVLANEANVAAGRTIYAANCASCHGPAGKGDGPASAGLDRKPADFSRAAMGLQTDGELYWKVTNGKKPMPEWRTLLSANDRWLVVLYVRSLGPAGPAAAPVGPAPGEAAQAPAAKALTPEEQAQLKKDVESLRAEVAALKGPSQPTEDTSSLLDVDRLSRKALDLADGLRLGTTKFFLAGTAHADFTYTDPARNTHARSTSVFSAGLEIDTLWKINDWIFFEGGIDAELTGPNSTDVSLALANVSFMVNDYLILRAGLMPTAFSRFKETLDAPWINKMADEPLLVGMVPDTMVGVEARGAIPLGPMRLIYSLYCVNDPVLNTDDPVQSGTVSFDNFGGFDNVPCFGAKVGIRTTPEFELGAAVLWSKVGNRGTDYRDTDDFQYDLYARFQQKYELGTLDIQAEWAWQHVRRATYVGPLTGPPDANGNPTPTFGPVRFTNETQSGYVQLAYRPTGADNDYVKKLEFLIRGDWLGQPRNALLGANNDTYRVAAGIDYWFTPSLVLKTEYEFSEIYAHPDRGKDGEQHMVELQIAMGF